MITQAEVLRIADELEATCRGEGQMSRDDMLTAAVVMRVAVDDFQLNNLACCEALMRACDAAEALGRDLWVRRDVAGKRWRVVLAGSGEGRAGSVVTQHSGLLPALTMMATAIKARFSVWHIFEHAGAAWRPGQPCPPVELPKFAMCAPHRAIDLAHGLGEGWSCRTMFSGETVDKERVIE